MRLNGRFGAYGGAYVPEILMPALEQLEAAFLDAQEDETFAAELGGLLATYAGRPTPPIVAYVNTNTAKRIAEARPAMELQGRARVPVSVMT